MAAMTHMTGKRPDFNSELLRKALGCFPTGVVVVTTLGNNNAPVGMTANSFSSVSLDPPLILWSIALTAPSLSAFRSHSGFTINILSEDQKDIGLQFARPSENKFEGIDWHPGYADTPVLDNALAVLQCKTYQKYEGGDHEIYLGEVQKVNFNDQQPLVFHRGNFGSLSHH